MAQHDELPYDSNLESGSHTAQSGRATDSWEEQNAQSTLIGTPRSEASAADLSLHTVGARDSPPSPRDFLQSSPSVSHFNETFSIQQQHSKVGLAKKHAETQSINEDFEDNGNDESDNERDTFVRNWNLLQDSLGIALVKFDNGEFDEAENIFLSVDILKGEFENAPKLRNEYLPRIRQARDLFLDGRALEQRGLKNDAKIKFLKIRDLMDRRGKAWADDLVRGSEAELYPFIARSGMEIHGFQFDLRVDSLIGEGATGVVVQLQGDNGRISACKLIEKTPENEPRVKNEIQSLWKARRIVQRESKARNHVVFITDYCTLFRAEISRDLLLRGQANGLYSHIVPTGDNIQYLQYSAILLNPRAPYDLRHYLNYELEHLQSTSTETQGKLRSKFFRWIHCLVATLADLHELNIRHRDIKPSNILVNGDDVLFTDFSLSFSGESGTEDNPTASFGSLRYVPPEIWDNMRRNLATGAIEFKTAQVASGKQGDVFSLGCVIFELLVALSKPLSGPHALPEVKDFYAPIISDPKFLHRVHSFREDTNLLTKLHKQYRFCELPEQLVRNVFDMMMVTKDKPRSTAAEALTKIEQTMMNHNVELHCHNFPDQRGEPDIDYSYHPYQHPPHSKHLYALLTGLRNEAP